MKQHVFCFIFRKRPGNSLFEAFRGISSLKLLAVVRDRIRDAGYAVENIDATVIAQRPKLSPYIGEMRQTLADVLGLPLDRVSIKATTEERLGFTGREEGVACHCVCLLQ